MSHLNYALSVWGPSLNKDLFSRLCRLYNRAVRVTCGLRKYDHVSDCRLGLRWLPLDLLIQHRALNVMYRYYTDDNCILLNPPVAFGREHTYTTRTPPYFANIFRCHLSFTKKFFRSSATSWWNSLPNFMFDSPLLSPAAFSRRLYSHLLSVT